ncbi:MAG: hypothetical protein PHE89_05000 [Alphaproteobacteria bacterium]|nr:hypothetical protein [Alphaproteobacteria bacterium]
MANEERLDIPKHDAFATYLGNKDITSLSVEEANKIVKGFNEWLKKEQEEQAKKEATEKDKDTTKEDKDSSKEPEKENKTPKKKVLNVGEKSNEGNKNLNINDGEKDLTWEERYAKNLQKHATGKAEYLNKFLEPGLTAVRVDSKTQQNEEFTYTAPNRLVVDGEKSLDGWRDQVLNAKDEKFDGINLADVKNENNRAKLYALAIAHGLNVRADNIPEVSPEILAQLTDKEREDFNKNKNKNKDSQQTDQKSETKTDQKPETKTDQKPETKTEQKPETKTEQKPETKTEEKPENKPSGIDMEAYKKLSFEERRQYVKDLATQKRGGQTIVNEFGDKKRFDAPEPKKNEGKNPNPTRTQTSPINRGGRQ